MRYAVFSDVHANLEALEAVLAVLKTAHIDRYIFLGDIVGYGANPTECIALLRELGPVMVAGNHDWASCGLLDLEYFNKEAQAALRWTQAQLSEPDRLFLGRLELVNQENGFCLVHGTLQEPGKFDYMIDGSRAAKTFFLLKQKICFVGHSHRPGVFIEDEEKVSYRRSRILKIEPEKRYVVNDGSVGQPRDGNPLAGFCIYDQERGTIEFRRLDYDAAGAQAKIRAAGLPAIFADRLAEGW